MKENDLPKEKKMEKGIGPTAFHFLYSERLNFLSMLLDKKLPEESERSKKKFRQ